VITWVKTSSGREIDFAIDDPVRGGPPRLVQVCERLDERATRQREIGALTQAMAELGCISATIVTLTEDEWVETGVGSIRIMPAREWFFKPADGSALLDTQ